MAHVPIDDARELFRETNPKTWSEFEKVVRQHKGKAEGIQDNLIDLMTPMPHHFEQEHVPFPNTPEQLQDLLNKRLAATGHRGYP